MAPISLVSLVLLDPQRLHTQEILTSSTYMVGLGSELWPRLM